MSTNRSFDRSAVTPQKDRATLCSLTFTDGLRCHTPRCDSRPALFANSLTPLESALPETCL
jgi:hypothetical protein